MDIEVDGESYHKESPAIAQKRLQHLENEGARVIRVEAKDCLDNAQKTAQEINVRIKQLLASR